MKWGTDREENLMGVKRDKKGAEMKCNSVSGKESASKVLKQSV